MRKFMGLVLAGALAVALTGCGDRVEVPPASVGKIMTKDGYQEGLIPPSKFRLPFCTVYCDRLVLLETSDKAYLENMSIFIPKDKLNLTVAVRTTLSLNPDRTEVLFNKITPEERSSSVSAISTQSAYQTYAQQIVQAEVREYLSQYSIAEIASSNEKINSDIQVRLSKTLQERTPFTVRYAGITNIGYPKIITDAQEASAERREAIQKEEAQLRISEVKMERELKEAQLRRAIEKEKAETEAIAQRTLAESVDSRVLQLRQLENDRAWIERWDGKLPTTNMGQAIPMVNLK